MSSRFGQAERFLKKVGNFPQITGGLAHKLPSFVQFSAVASCVFSRNLIACEGICWDFSRFFLACGRIFFFEGKRKNTHVRMCVCTHIHIHIHIHIPVWGTYMWGTFDLFSVVRYFFFFCFFSFWILHKIQCATIISLGSQAVLSAVLDRNLIQIQ